MFHLLASGTKAILQPSDLLVLLALLGLVLQWTGWAAGLGRRLGVACLVLLVVFGLLPLSVARQSG
jgi:hypothetical protein